MLRQTISAHATVVVLLLLSACGGDQRGESTTDDSPDPAPSPRRHLVIDTDIGVGGVVVDRRGTELRLVATARGIDFDGTVTIQPYLEPWFANPSQPQRRHSVTYRLPLELPRDTPKEFSIPLRPASWYWLELDFRSPGFRQTVRLDVPQLAAVRTRVLAVTERVVDARAMADFFERCVEESKDHDHLSAARRCSVTSIRPQSMPRSSGTAFEAFDLVMIFGNTLADAPAGARDALWGWVRGGGNLVVFPGPAWNAGTPPQFEEFLGVRRVTDGDAPDRVLRPELGVAVNDQPLRGSDGSEALYAGLAYRSRRGFGTVTTFRFGFPDAFPDPEEFPQLYEVLEQTLARSASPHSRHAVALADIEAQAPLRLFGSHGISIPPTPIIVFCLILYIGVGLGAMAVVVRRLLSPEWFFAWAVLCAVLLTAGIYRFGLLSLGQRAEVTEIAFARLADDGAVQVARFTSLMAPRGTRVQLQRPDAKPPTSIDTARVTPLDYDPSFGGGRRSLRDPVTVTLDRLENHQLREAFLRANVVRYFRFDERMENQDLISVRRPEGGRRGLYLRNRTAHRFYPQIVWRRAGQRLPALEPNEERYFGVDDDTPVSPPRINDGPTVSELDLTAMKGRPSRGYWGSTSMSELIFERYSTIVRAAETGKMADRSGVTDLPALRRSVRESVPRLLILAGRAELGELPQAWGHRRSVTAFVFELP